MKTWLQQHKFQLQSVAFLLMILPLVLMFSAAQSGNDLFILVLTGLVVAGNILVLFLL